MINKWNLQTLSIEELHEKDELAKELGLNPITCQLLIQRGITSADEVKKFFKPSLNNLHDPFLMPDMDKAVKRLDKALGNKEKILVYGDYDVDGTTAVSLVYKFLRQYSSTLDYYIPDRYDEGYGISYKGIDYAAENGFSLIIALDCGIKAIDKIEYAKTKGIDFIICDHHMPDDTLPDAVAVLDAKRVDSIYPYEHLSGCGVGFKFMQAFAKSNGFPFSKLENLLDLIAVSIASDIVPITGENRILAHYGLKQLNSNPGMGLKGIIDICGLTGKPITINDIVFKIGPRINASGRMMNGKEAVDLLLAKDTESAREKSENINQYNDERRELDKKITDEANAVIDTFSNMEDRKAIVVYEPSWHKGVIGIVASRLTEKYYRPAVVLTKSSELITGSARSITGFDIYKAIENCRDLLENFGGHTYAAGLSMREENLEEFTKRFLEQASGVIDPEQMTPQIDIDAVLEMKDITSKLSKELNKMSPFGPENQKPVFCSLAVRDYGTSKLVGKDSDHIKLELIDDNSKIPVHAIAFGMSQHFDYIKSMKPFNICYTIEENAYNTKAPQLLIKDIKTDDL
ncbi:single-stranded-DNA-specific exonuclease [Parabacteroides sp. PF5-5]|uniref:single-stranded-DNA-specific exonuclease RecJ n=1 Tax=unclassified Parabacteroides TaxID=2649774 RepID=UPI002476E8A0|nr:MULTISPECIES: single-stranded-DNA-specific exonuclease RecJ [unclassified Parabacteroides]MDH6303872.1 single-stranded-DNA-specific exonuclease [Parabacteroides sp. PH5-39]MDH6314489.1 single-stranded-DNA-specific exonuclease [Parabacteroides sp. PF5-13]MDH6318446.1 single-stranded-DNA-specific exonuclease [Parabacteroides sp. PH5-13]MDH6322261.1 single-stranded-DNA-specific exonuclease [Parabacteroides sp. PH5-8]MDH6325659.1 single-stranded-DNA-specific exonuclease [Parabacteroides sp. PH5